jgi:putative hydrolase of the HAD superfamily
MTRRKKTGGRRRSQEAPMLPFDVILFDVGGVLLTNGWDHKERAAVVQNFGLDVAEFEARHPEPNDAWEKDEITAKEYLDATVFYKPRSFTHEDFLKAIFAQSVLLTDSALLVLKEISSTQRYLVGALNNEAREPNEYRFQRYELRKYFEIALSSCYIGLRKPNLEMYKRAIDILGRPAERVLFIDDRQGNVDSAVDAGMKAIRFTGAENLRRELEKLDVF